MLFCNLQQFLNKNHGVAMWCRYSSLFKIYHGQLFSFSCFFGILPFSKSPFWYWKIADFGLKKQYLSPKTTFFKYKKYIRHWRRFVTTSPVNVLVWEHFLCGEIYALLLQNGALGTIYTGAVVEIRRILESIGSGF